MQFSKLQYWFLALLSGLLLAISWPMRGLPPVSFIAFIPLLLLEDGIRNDSRSYKSARIYAFGLLAFVCWNLLTTYWIKNAAMVGLLSALLVNGSLMSLAFLIYHKIRNQFSHGQGGQVLIIFPWLAFEYLHLDWDLSWSWLNLGGIFGAWPQWMQWYEFTGSLGGSVWILLLNVFLYKLVTALVEKERAAIRRSLIFSSLLIVIPLAISIAIYHNYEEKSDPVDIVVVQPNVDPYSEKYDRNLYKDQLSLMLNLARSKTDQHTDFIAFPESALQERIWERKLDRSYSIDSIEVFMNEFPNASVIMGASTYRMYQPGEELQESARLYSERNGVSTYYDPFNTMLFMEKDQEVGFYHKSMLVAGVEQMPFSEYLGFINDDFALDLGGIVGTLGSDDERAVFTSKDDSICSGITICYESVYGDFFSEFVRNGAEIMFIITNDGWWGNTPGYKQHFLFAPIRAIESRRSIARSANTGISGFINQRGDVIARSEYWVKDVMRAELNRNDKITFYTNYGDYLGRIATFITALFLLISLSRYLMTRKRK